MGQSLAQALDRARKSRVLDGLQQVVDGRALECVDRVLVECGDEHDV